MATTRNLGLLIGSALMVLSSIACTSSNGDTTSATVQSTTTTIAGSGPAIRVLTNDPADLARLLAAWAIPQGADGYVGACAAEPSAMPPASTWCSVETTAADGQVFQMFHPGASTASAVVLIAPSDGYYRIEDSYTFGVGTRPAWADPAT